MRPFHVVRVHCTEEVSKNTLKGIQNWFSPRCDHDARVNIS